MQQTKGMDNEQWSEGISQTKIIIIIIIIILFSTSLFSYILYIACV